MNQTFRAEQVDIIIYANKPVVDCDFQFTYDDEDGEEQPYDFSAQDGLFLKFKDKKDGKILASWTQADGLSLVDNAIRWNEYDAAEMDFAQGGGKVWYEIGYNLDDYTPDDIEIVLGYGWAKCL
jgi:hypothetical protein